jgi:hypothetical protein
MQDAFGITGQDRSFTKPLVVRAVQPLAINVDNLLLDDVVHRTYPFPKRQLKLLSV